MKLDEEGKKEGERYCRNEHYKEEKSKQNKIRDAARRGRFAVAFKRHCKIAKVSGKIPEISTNFCELKI